MSVNFSFDVYPKTEKKSYFKDQISLIDIKSTYNEGYTISIQNDPNDSDFQFVFISSSKNKESYDKISDDIDKINFIKRYCDYDSNRVKIIFILCNDLIKLQNFFTTYKVIFYPYDFNEYYNKDQLITLLEKVNKWRPVNNGEFKIIEKLDDSIISEILNYKCIEVETKNNSNKDKNELIKIPGDYSNCISNNEKLDKIFKIVRQNVTLRILNLSNNKLKKFDMANIIKAPHLTKLILDDNLIEDIVYNIYTPSIIDRSTRKLSVSLKNNNLKRIRYPSSYNWLNLVHTLDLRGNPLIDIPKFLSEWMSGPCCLYMDTKMKLNFEFIKESNTDEQAICKDCSTYNRLYVSHFKQINYSFIYDDNEGIHFKNPSNVSDNDKREISLIVSSSICQKCWPKYSFRISNLYCWKCNEISKELSHTCQNKLANLPTNQLTNQPINQPTIQLTNQPTNQLIYQPTNQLTNQQTSQFSNPSTYPYNLLSTYTSSINSQIQPTNSYSLSQQSLVNKTPINNETLSLNNPLPILTKNTQQDLFNSQNPSSNIPDNSITKDSFQNDNSKNVIQLNEFKKPETFMTYPVDKSKIDNLPPNLKEALSNYIPNTNLDTTIYKCDLCQITCSSYEGLLQHREGKKHKHNLEATMEDFTCEMCNVKATNLHGIQLHRSGAKHKKIMATKSFCVHLPIGEPRLYVVLTPKENSKFECIHPRTKEVAIFKKDKDVFLLETKSWLEGKRYYVEEQTLGKIYGEYEKMFSTGLGRTI